VAFGSSPSDRLSLRLLRERDARELHELIEANREDLATWLPWAAAQTMADSEAFIARSREQLEADEAVQVAVVQRGRIVGMVGFPQIDWQRRMATIGYWLTAEERGSGLASAAVRQLVRHAFDVWELEWVEIRVAAENRRSRAVAERLAFRQDRVLAGAELVGERRLDLVVYAMTAAQWRLASREPGAQRRRR